MMTNERRERRRTYQREYHRRRRQQKRERCECTICTKPATVGTMCKRHYEHRRQYAKQFKQRYPDYYSNYMNTWTAEIRQAVFDYYGNECAHCGTTENLEIDHVNNDGREHREREGIQAGLQTYQWLIRHDFPEGFQTLCKGCNVRKHHAYRRRLKATQAMGMAAD